MIEHFKKFDEGDKSLLPLSFSHLNEFAFYRERWALRRIFGYQFPTSASAERGSAVESGLNMVLNGISVEEASKKMIDEYNANCSRITDPKIDDERENLINAIEDSKSSVAKSAGAEIVGGDEFIDRIDRDLNLYAYGNQNIGYKISSQDKKVKDFDSKYSELEKINNDIESKSNFLQKFIPTYEIKWPV